MADPYVNIYAAALTVPQPAIRYTLCLLRLHSRASTFIGDIHRHLQLPSVTESEVKHVTISAHFDGGVWPDFLKAKLSFVAHGMQDVPQSSAHKIAIGGPQI